MFQSLGGNIDNASVSTKLTDPFDCSKLWSSDHFLTKPEAFLGWFAPRNNKTVNTSCGTTGIYGPQMFSKSPSKVSNFLSALATSLHLPPVPPSNHSKPEVNIAHDLSMSRSPPTSILSVERLLSDTPFSPSSATSLDDVKEREAHPSPSASSSSSSAALSPKLSGILPPNMYSSNLWCQVFNETRATNANLNASRRHQSNERMPADCLAPSSNVKTDQPEPNIASFWSEVCASSLFKSLLLRGTAGNSFSFPPSTGPPRTLGGFIPPPPLTWMKLLHQDVTRNEVSNLLGGDRQRRAW